MRNWTLLLLILGLFQCSEQSLDSDGNPSGQVLISISVAGQPKVFTVTSRKAISQADGGVVVAFTGTVDGDTDTTFTVDIAGGTTVTPNTAIPVGGSSPNVRLTVGDGFYRGTSGNVTFTSYSVDLGGAVAGSFSVLLTGFGSTQGQTSSVQSEFDLTLESPS